MLQAKGENLKKLKDNDELAMQVFQDHLIAGGF
jgi:hypothetical protein